MIETTLRGSFDHDQIKQVKDGARMPRKGKPLKDSELTLLCQEMLSWKTGCEIWDSTAIIIIGRKQNFRDNISAKLNNKRLQAHCIALQSKHSQPQTKINKAKKKYKNAGQGRNRYLLLKNGTRRSTGAILVVEFWPSRSGQNTQRNNSSANSSYDKYHF